jgi:hypothetical protein
LQTKFSKAKREGNKELTLRCIDEEKQTAIKLLELVRLDARIGYEASNHYFYTERNILEKILRTEKMEESLA